MQLSIPGQGNKASKPLTEKICGGCPSGRNSQSTGEFLGKTHRVLECTQTHLSRNQHQKGPICLWVVGEMTESWPRAEQVALFPLRPLPPKQHHNATKRVALPWQIPKAPPPYNITHALRQRNMVQMKEQIKTPEKQLSDEETDNLSDTEFETL